MTREKKTNDTKKTTGVGMKSQGVGGKCMRKPRENGSVVNGGVREVSPKTGGEN